MNRRERQWEFDRWIGQASGPRIGAVESPAEIWEQLERWYAWGVSDALERVKVACEEVRGEE